MITGVRNTQGTRVPILPRKVNDEIRLTPGEVEETKKRNPIMPRDRNINKRTSIKIVKPDLTKE